ncbi:nitrogenase iron-molybdenum cofactor biosynthesis protein NifN [Celerinatantimonas sp. YJH-8]|uniref:nitrogenase iron-molybdenum cofactor biosynthesis protein NifN n=1 Tax=Celerinatantimonas sp. YJH-8 TaxID=3228714 RepID=UPI0038BF697A
MAEIIKTRKPLSISPLKTGQVMGASLAALGIADSIALMHAAQGCSSFAKAFFVRHFQEPIAMQSTAMDPISTIMGADNNIKLALDLLAKKKSAKAIIVMSNGLSEAQGADLSRAIKEFRQEYPEHEQLAIVTVSTPDFYGSLESGYGATVEAIIDQLVPSDQLRHVRKKRINILAGHSLTAGDIEAVTRLVESFGLNPIFIPDLSESLDGHLGDQDYTSVSQGGTRLSDLAKVHESIASLSIGISVHAAAKKLAQKTQVATFYFDHLGDFENCDRLVEVLIELTGRQVPEYINRERRQVQDALLDCHNILQGFPIAMAAEPESLGYWLAIARMTGLDERVVVAPANHSYLVQLPTEKVMIGDFSDLEVALADDPVKLLISNSHGHPSAERLGIAHVLCGFPMFDHYGGFRRNRQLYGGIRDTLFELANLIHHQLPKEAVYHSTLKQHWPKAV